MRAINYVGLALMPCVAVFTLISDSISTAQTPPPPVAHGEHGAMQPRWVPDKPLRSELTPSDEADVIIFKFSEGTHVRLRGTRLVAELDRASAQERVRRERSNISEAAVKNELAIVERLIAQFGRTVYRLFGRAEDVLENDRAIGEAASNVELADLNLYYVLHATKAERPFSEALLDQLNALDIIEVAYASAATWPADDIEPPTLSYVTAQGYLGPDGIDANFARMQRNARGQTVRIIDIEYNWNRSHEDLPSVSLKWGLPQGDKNHGTAVLGVLGAPDNGYGVTGVAPRARLGVASIYFKPGFPPELVLRAPARAINEAGAQLARGDILLIELQRQGPDSGLTNICGGDSFEAVPLEYDQAVFDAIRQVAAKGVVVVEGAGNGAMNLDSALYGDRFNRAVRDSGAIMVGASMGRNRVPTCWTNYGSRVDAFAWGEGVVTLGRGDLVKVDGSDQRQWYTNSFGGTSAAGSIVAGAVAVVQSALALRGLPRLTAPEMVQLFQIAGRSQASSFDRSIGRTPDLRGVFRAYEAGDVCTEVTLSTTAVHKYGYLPPYGERNYCFDVNLADTAASAAYGFDTCANTQFPTTLTLHSATGPLSPAVFACGPGGMRTQLTWRFTSQGTYRLRLRGNGSQGGSFDLRMRKMSGQSTLEP